MQTGKVAWTVERFGSGTITLAGEHLFVLKEDGELVIVPALPKAFQAVARAQIRSGTVRAYPALAHGRLYARNEKSLVCLSLKK
ncbi:MAG: hypothetical protein L0312_17220, partial [Acidobacteria bacterium]|nr:hypothetical protein [Acidobacteriota bacterium]